MTKTILALSLLFSLPLFAATPSADYNLNLHVSETRIGTDCGVAVGNSTCKSVQLFPPSSTAPSMNWKARPSFPKASSRLATTRRG